MRLSKALHGDSTSKISTYFCIKFKTFHGLEYFNYSQEKITAKNIILRTNKQFNVIVCCEITKTHSTCKLLICSLISTLLFYWWLFGQRTTQFSDAYQVFDSYVRSSNYALLAIAEMPNNELTSIHTLSLPPLHL